MSKIFEKLLLMYKILSEEELEQYRQIQANSSPPRHLGEILCEKNRISKEILVQLERTEQQTQRYFKILRKQRKDKKVLETVQKLGIVRQEEIARCIREHHEAEAKGEYIFLTEIFIEKGYLTPYLVHKFYRRGEHRITLPEGIKSPQELVINIPKYLKDQFFAKIALKNAVISQPQLHQSWLILKKNLLRKSLAQIFFEKNLLSEKKIHMLLSVLKNALPERYPYFHAYIRDLKLAKLIVKRNFLSLWRINKCILKQMEGIKKKDYLPLRHILVNNGYLTPYQFDVVLKSYGEIVSTEIPALFLVPSDEIESESKEELEQIGCGFSLVLEERENKDNVAAKATLPKQQPHPPVESAATKPDTEEEINLLPDSDDVLADTDWKQLVEKAASFPTIAKEETEFPDAEEIETGIEEELTAEPVDEDEKAINELDANIQEVFNKGMLEPSEELPQEDVPKDNNRADELKKKGDSNEKN